MKIMNNTPTYLFIFVTGIGPSETDSCELDQWLADELNAASAKLRANSGFIWEVCLDEDTAAQVFDAIVDRSSAYFVMVIRQRAPIRRGKPTHSLFRVSPNFAGRTPMPPTKRIFDRDVNWWVDHCARETEAAIQQAKDLKTAEDRKKRIL